MTYSDSLKSQRGDFSQLVPQARKMLHELVKQWQPHLRCVPCARLHVQIMMH